MWRCCKGHGQCNCSQQANANDRCNYANAHMCVSICVCLLGCVRKQQCIMNAPRCVGVRVMLNMDTQKVATAQ